MLRENPHQQLPEAMLVTRTIPDIDIPGQYLLKVQPGRHHSVFQDVLVKEALREKAEATTVWQIAT